MYDIPFLDLPPLVGASGTVQLPGSKSISNRVLLLAGLAAGTTTVHELLDSDDTRVMIDALRALGCGIERDSAHVHTLRVTGLGGRLQVREADLFLGNAGTAMRPLAATLAVLSTLQGGRYTLRGVPRMHERPIGDLVNALRPLGCRIDELGTPGYPPLAMHGAAGGTLALAAPVRVRGDVSSQFLTALLLALPLAAGAAGREQDIVIEVEGELISKPYIEITLNLLARFGIVVRNDAWQRFVIPAGSAYVSPGAIAVEGDASSASYFVALGAIAAHGGAPLRIEGVGEGSIQGDIRFVDAAEAMGAQVRRGPGWLEVHRGQWPLKPIHLDCTAIPDAAMTLAVMALFAQGMSRLDGIASWRVKETDRIAAMAAELGKLGATVVAGDDFIEVTPPVGRWRAAAIHTYDDHRMAMCLSLAACHALLPGREADAQPLRILDPKCVAKTFPEYFEALFGVVEAAAVPVIAIDGPTASGKGTLAAAVAAALGYGLLDSGALYRATGLAAVDAGLDPEIRPDDEAAVAALAARLPLRFGQGAEAGRSWFDGAKYGPAGREITDELRLESTGLLASRVSALPAVRAALHGLQLSFCRAPGLVADGRDMGTVVFPDAGLKVFLTASAEQRAQRRHKQLISKGIPASIAALRADLEARDRRDTQRTASPLKPAEDAKLLDNSQLGIDESVQQVLAWWQERRPFS
jgi:3-phosphoshikimate 1-carboxyvinyltransferase